MTEQDVEIFLAVVRWGSISAAAEAMFITQPAVSRHIRELERELGCPLVRRSKGRRHIELTEQGERRRASGASSGARRGSWPPGSRRPSCD